MLLAKRAKVILADRYLASLHRLIELLFYFSSTSTTRKVSMLAHFCYQVYKSDPCQPLSCVLVPLNGISLLLNTSAVCKASMLAHVCH